MPLLTTFLTVATLSSPGPSLHKMANPAVSYVRRERGGANISNVFVDAQNDPSGETFLALQCLGSVKNEKDKAGMEFHFLSRKPLAKTETRATLLVDAGSLREEVPGKIVRTSVDNGRFGRWTAAGTAADGQVIKLLFAADHKLSLSVRLPDGKRSPTYTFDTTGMLDALTKVNDCKDF